MKLSKLVASKDSMKQKSTNDFFKNVDEFLTNLISDVEQVEIDTSNISSKLTQQRNDVLVSLRKYEEILSEFKDQLNLKIEGLSPSYYQMSEEVFATAIDDSSYTNDRYLFDAYIKHDEISNAFKQRIELYADWKHSGLFIRPEKGEYVDSMIANDPLYIADHNKQLMLLTRDRWTPEFQSRIRYVYVNEDRDLLLPDLPLGQLGLIVIFHFFNYKPLDLIKKYLSECYNILKPGGVILFTYNNCDLPDAVRQAENAYQSYTPGTTLLSFAEALGFEILHTFDYHSNVSWAELKKPGELTSMRGGQALAQIKDSRLDK
jgi:SAM-dependent methyltransferase